MKTVCKVFLIISIIGGFITLLLGAYLVLEALSSSGYGYDNIAIMIEGGSYVVTGLLPVIIGFIAMSKLNHATTKQELTGIGVLTLILCSAIAGFIMLLIKDEDLK